MEKPTFKLVGAPCGQHGQYSFYKALRYTGTDGAERVLALGDFFFVRLWQDSQLVSVGELQLLWTDRVSDQTLVSLRLYFLPENTPDGRGAHGQDEVLAIGEKVVLRAGDVLGWACRGDGWRCGLPAVWRGACAPRAPTAAEPPEPLHASRLDFADVEREKAAIEDPEAPGVVVFSYPRYCRYRALLRRLDGLASAWLRDSLVAALGGYAAPTRNTRILFCRDTFEYPELEGHEFVCNHLAPRLKGRPRGRRRRRARSHSLDPPSDRERSPSDTSVSSDRERDKRELTPPRAQLRNGCAEERATDRAFMSQLRAFHRDHSTPLKHAQTLKDLRLRSLYQSVVRSGGYEQVCRERGWRGLHGTLQGRPASPSQATLTRRHYERLLLPFEKHERRNGSKWWKLPKLHNGTSKEHSPKQDRKKLHDSTPITTIDITAESPVREIVEKCEEMTVPRLRTPSPAPEQKIETINLNSSGNDSLVKVDEEKPPADPYDPSNLLTSDEKDTKEHKPAAELNQEFLDSLPKEDKPEEKTPIKISVKPVEKLIERKTPPALNCMDPSQSMNKLLGTPGLTEYLQKQSLTDLSASLLEMAAKQNSDTPVSLLAEFPSEQSFNEMRNNLRAQLAAKQGQVRDMATKPSLGDINTSFLAEIAKAQQELLSSTTLGGLSGLGDKLAGYATLAAGFSNGLPNGTMITVQQASDKLQSGAGGTVSPPSRPAGRSLLRSVRVKPTRTAATAPPTPSVTPLRPDSASSSPPAPPPVTNFGINYVHERHNQVTSSTQPPHELPHSDDEIIEVPYKPKTPEIIDLDDYESPESPQAVKKKKLDILKERGLEVTAVGEWTPPPALVHPGALLGLNPAVQQQIMTQAQFFQMYNQIMPQGYTNGLTPPKVIQGKSIYGSPGPEKTVYGNPKDPFMPPPHVLQGAPPLRHRSPQAPPPAPAPDILDLSSKQPHRPAVEIMRVPTVPSPAKVPSAPPQNLTKSYSLIDGKAVVGSNLEITLVKPRTPQPTTPPKGTRPRQKRSSTGQFMSNKTPSSPTFSKAYATPAAAGAAPAARLQEQYKASERAKQATNIVIPTYQMSNSSRDSDVSPTSSTSSRDGGIAALTTSLLQAAGGALLQSPKAPSSLAQIMEMQAKSTAAQNLASFMDPSVYMSAVYSSLAGQLSPGLPDHQLAMYQNLMSGRLMRNYPGLLNMSTVTSTPTTKN